ncbi:hypothetical protein NFI96_027584, partial [Prochilodus magdalenae]
MMRESRLTSFQQRQINSQLKTADVLSQSSSVLVLEDWSPAQFGDLHQQTEQGSALQDGNCWSPFTKSSYPGIRFRLIGKARLALQRSDFPKPIEVELPFEALHDGALKDLHVPLWTQNLWPEKLCVDDDTGSPLVPPYGPVGLTLHYVPQLLWEGQCGEVDLHMISSDPLGGGCLVEVFIRSFLQFPFGFVLHRKANDQPATERDQERPAALPRILLLGNELWLVFFGLPEGDALPVVCNPTSSAPLPRPQLQLRVSKGPALSARPQRRSAEKCRAGENYTRETYRPSATRDLEKEKRRLQGILATGQEEPRPTLSHQQPTERGEDRQIDRFQEVLDEIEERREFLEEMNALGRGHQYQHIINSEISQVERPKR